MADEVTYHLDQLAHFDIPITVYHFDGEGWADGNCGWKLGDSLRARLQTDHVRALLHFWGCCVQPQVCDTIDAERVYGQLGNTLGGFYLDEGATDALARYVTDWAQARLPRDAEVVMKANQSDGRQTSDGLAAYGHSCYVNDLTSDFTGLNNGIDSVFARALTLPAPFNEFTGYDPLFLRADEETYVRRLHFGALQPVMDHSPLLHASPWETAHYSPDLLTKFRYYSWLHYELVPYLHSYDWLAFETGAPILRDPDATNNTTKLGEELFVAYIATSFVGEPGTPQLDIKLPAGEWIDYWDVSQSYSGDITRPVPLGREPIFIRAGAIIPLQVSRNFTAHGTRASEGSLTVMVYPSSKSRFRYRDDNKDRWIDIGAELTGDTLVLGASEFPSQPLLYRVERWNSAPSAVQVCGTTVMVNGPAGLPESSSEDSVNGATRNAWYYDSVAKRLIVKALP